VTSAHGGFQADRHQLRHPQATLMIFQDWCASKNWQSKQTLMIAA
jgi:hypothetical protein